MTAHTVDSRVECQRCSRSLRVSLGQCLANGWPTCCAQTMLLVDTPPKAEIDRIVTERMSAPKAVLKAMRRG